MPRHTRYRGTTTALVLLLTLALGGLPLGLGPVGQPVAGALIQEEGTRCHAVGNNWTGCDRALASDDVYAYGNGTLGELAAVSSTTEAQDASLWSFSHTVPGGADRVLVLTVATDSGEDVLGTPQYGLQSFTPLQNIVHSSGKPRVAVYYLVAPLEGLHMVTGTLTGSDKFTIGAVSYTGVSALTPVDGVITAEGDSGNAIQLTVPSETGDLVQDVTANLGSSVPVVGSGQSELFNREMGGNEVTSHRATASVELGATSVTMRWTNKENGKEWVSVGFNLNRADSLSGGSDTAWEDFGIVLDPADTVGQVEVGVEWYRNASAPTLNVTVSWNGGVSWAPNQTATDKTADDDLPEWLDFTSATAWNANSLSDGELQVRVSTNGSGALLDYLAVRVHYNDAPRVEEFRLETVSGQSRAGELLDPATPYRFLFQITDEDGWIDIGEGGYVALHLWYDGGGTAELPYTEQINGSAFRVELRYEDLGDPANATWNEWSVTEGGATFNASASSATPVLRGATHIGYAFRVVLRLAYDVQATPDPTNTTPGGYNDPDSWNAEVVVDDGALSQTLQVGTAGDHMEFGVFARPLLSYAQTSSRDQLAPGEESALRVDFVNDGQGEASAVWVNVTLPPELLYIGDDAAAHGGAYTECCHRFQFSPVGPGPHGFNITVQALGGVANDTFVVVAFDYAARDTRGRWVNQSSGELFLRLVNAVLTYDLSPLATNATPGEAVVVQIALNNTGEGAAGQVWANATLPGALTYLADDAGAIGGVGNGTDFLFENLSPGRYVFHLTVAARAGVPNGTLAVVTVAFAAFDPQGASLGASSAQASVTILNARLDTALEISALAADPGDLLVYSLTLHNVGQESAYNVSVVVSLDPALSYRASSPLGNYSAAMHTLRWGLERLPPSSSLLLAWTLQVNPGAADGRILQVAARVDYTDGSAALPPLFASENVTVRAPSFSPQLLLNAETAERADEVLATLRYDNLGTGIARAAWANWTLYGHFAVLGLTSDLPYEVTEEGLAVTLASISPGSHSMEVRLLVVRGLADGWNLDLDVMWEATDGNGNHVSSASLNGTVILRAPDLRLDARAPLTQVNSGTLFSVDVVLANDGQAPALVWLNLSLPAGVAYQGDNGTVEPSVTADQLSWIFPSLPAHSTLWLEVRLTTGEEVDVVSLRFVSSFTDGRGSPPETLLSPGVSVQITPPGFDLLSFWPLGVALAVIPVAALVAYRRRRPESPVRKKDATVDEVFVVDQGGSLIAHRSNSILQSTDEDLVVGMLTAVQSYVRDVFSENGDALRSIEVGPRKVHFEQGSFHYLAVVYRGEGSEEISARAAEVNQQIERRFSDVLLFWNGDLDEVKAIGGLLPRIWERG